MKFGGKVQKLLQEVGASWPTEKEEVQPPSKDPSRYRDRIASVSGAAALTEKTVFVIGLGSVGSSIATWLVRMGSRVIGFDPDVLTVENLIRWGLLATIKEHVGLRKADIWQELTTSAVPGARATAHAMDVVQEATSFDACFAEYSPHLLIAATDTADSRRMVNAMAARHKVPALFVGLADGAASVRVEIVEDAERGPCHLCAMHAEGFAEGSMEAARRSRTPYAAEVADGNQIAGVPAMPMDVALGALVAGRIAARMLAGESIESLLRNGEQRGNVLFLSLQRGFWLFEDVWDRFVYQVERDPDCPACGRVLEAPMNVSAAHRTATVDTHLASPLLPSAG